MKKMQEAIQAYKDAVMALQGHLGSEFAMGKGTVEKTQRLQAYLDLANWPESPLLEGLDAQAKEELRVWGEAYSQALKAFHQKTSELADSRLAALHQALLEMGMQAGQEFLAMVGPLDERVAKVLSDYDSKRRHELDGIGYVDVLDANASFGKGFYKSCKMKRVPFYADLRLCAQYREGSIKLNSGEKTRLGFVEEVCDESR